MKPYNSLRAKSVDFMPWAGYFMIVKIGFDYTFLTGRQKRESNKPRLAGYRNGNTF
jgi:hypothetical protein